MEPKKPQKPLTNLQVWGAEDEEMPEMEPADDELIEEILAEGDDDDFGCCDGETCIYCGEPMSLCTCFGAEHYED